MFRSAVYEMDAQRKNILHDYLIRYSFEKGLDMDVLLFTDQQAVRRMERYAGQLCLVFVSLEDSCGQRFGSRLYHLNPACRICYYRTAPCDLEPLLTSRPISFLLWQPDQKEFSNLRDNLILEIEAAEVFLLCNQTGELSSSGRQYHVF